MKTVAIVLAGGESEKEGNSVPRQFVHVYDKPVLVYTLEGFQRHPQIDEIGVVCLSGWEEMVWAYSKQFNVNKLKWVVSGGENGQESIYNGIKHLINSNSSVEIVIIHDGIRPLIDESVLTDVLVIAKEKGNAISVLPYTEQLFLINKEDEEVTNEYIDRDTIVKVSTPQAFRFEVLSKVYSEAIGSFIGFDDDSYADTLMVDMGNELYFSKGSEKNMKLNSSDDFEMFKVYLNSEKDYWMK